MGPELTHEAANHADIEWQVGHLKEPARFTPGSSMPGYPQLSPDDLHALAEYMASRD